MDSSTGNKNTQSALRQLSNLKLLSRLLGHELRAQGNARTITLSREEVTEMQTSIDLYIEEMTRGQGSASRGATADTQMVTATRN